MALGASLPFERICGLRPKTWLCVGDGFAREDVKALLLSLGQGFVGEAVTTLQDICLRLSSLDRTLLLNSFSRQEILKTLLLEPRISAQLPELKRLKRQKNFFKRLDSAIQAGRMTFAHDQEEEVYEERLTQIFGQNSVRQEVRVLSRAYTTWLEVKNLLDLPLLIQNTLRSLQEKGWPAKTPRPEEIFVLSVKKPESLEKELWDYLSQTMQITFSNHLHAPQAVVHPIQWDRWHTLDDAAEELASHLKTSAESWNDHAVLIPDIPSVRRSLIRALSDYSIPLADLRDPTRLRWEESIKRAILPLEVVSSQFERQKVTSWLKGKSNEPQQYVDWVLDMNTKGIRQGLTSYRFSLSDAYPKLLELQEKLGGKKTCEEFQKIHLEFIQSELASSADLVWVLPLIKTVWEDLQKDMARLEQENKKAPLYFWLDKFQTRLRESSPPVDRLKPEDGLQIYRLQQAPLKSVKHLWVFGLPAKWLEGDGGGDLWYSEQERELLAVEFSVRSRFQIREERLLVLKSWIQGAESVSILDSCYASDGREKESILPILKELALVSERTLAVEMEGAQQETDRGAHPRFVNSYRALKSIQPQELNLPALHSGPYGQKVELSATLIDHQSRCSFQALAYHRWKLRDIRLPDFDLWPESKGMILHEAVRLLVKSIDRSGNFSISIEQAIEMAWKARPPRGLIQSKRAEHYVKSRMFRVLLKFCEKEKEYQQRSETRPVSLDDKSFRLEFDRFSIVGKPDRIDQHKDGLFIIDYKTSGTVPNGSDMVENGYRLQLPFYALAVERNLRQPVVGVQFVEFDRSGARRNGIFFKKHNGKEKGSLTQVRANSKSLFTAHPSEVWSTLEKSIVELGNQYQAGQFKAVPRIQKKECDRCKVGDLCGLQRRT